MAETDWEWGATCVGPHKLLIWLEPWAEEFEVPVGSTIKLRFAGGFPEDHQVEIELGTEHVVIWASAGQMVRVSIDDTIQPSASASIPVPTTDFEGSTKDFFSLMFGTQPIERLRGERAELRLSLWQRAKRFLQK